MTGRRWLLAGVIASVGVLAPFGATQAAVGGGAPAGYQLLAKQFTAYPGAFTTLGSVACPSGTATWGGGGGQLAAISPAVSFSQSYWDGATPGTWNVAVANTTTKVLTGWSAVICAKPPKGFQLVTTTVDQPAGAVSTGTATCPSSKVLLSGGVASTSDMTNVSIDYEGPTSNRTFKAALTNDSSAEQSFHVYAMCATKPTGYVRVTISAGVPDQDVFGTSRSCPAKTKVIGGGVVITAGATVGVLAEESGPDLLNTPHGMGWDATVSNTSGSSITLKFSAICAA